MAESVVDQSYSVLASEYYDSVRHPTCANFRAASESLFRYWFNSRVHADSMVLEVGAGRSIAAELMVELKRPLGRLMITDASAEMLSYSADFEVQGARLIQCEASAIPTANSSVDIVVASLGDPFNQPDFWGEATRVLRKGGMIFYTTPSFEWATRYRIKEQSPHRSASFSLCDGRRVLVRSDVFSITDQTAMIEQFELKVLETKSIRISALPSDRISPKLLVNGQMDIPVVTGYVARKL